ncbi:Alpha-mannosidase 2 [Balamuthia mandrillaris]
MTRPPLYDVLVTTAVVLVLSSFALAVTPQPSLTATRGGTGGAERTTHVYMIPHSHCDPGWLLTFEQYHQQQVATILTNVVQALNGQPHRRFVWAEISFFSRWFDAQELSVQATVKKLLQNKQFEFVEGGWVQPDEANTNFDVLINQITEGHDYILKHFGDGARPRIAWQIDPFGHSSMTPTLASLVGFDALVINRIHFGLKERFKQTKHMEFVWQGSPTLGNHSEIFTHVLHTHYSAPEGFDFENVRVTLGPSNLKRYADKLVSMLKGRSHAYKTNNLLVPFGDDFKFRKADTQFSNMDMLIEYINAHSDEYNLDIRYATVSEYFDAVHQEQAAFPLYKGDFFPYADNKDSYWTGYYTTRPRLKRLTRTAFSLLHSAESAFVFARSAYNMWQNELDNDARPQTILPWTTYFRDLSQARKDTALVLHHDGITGTAKKHVAQDYITRLEEAESHSKKILLDSTKYLLQKSSSDASQLPPLQYNVDTPIAFSDNYFEEYPVVVHNSLGWTRYQYIKVPIRTIDIAALRVFDADGRAVPSQITPVVAFDGSDNSFTVRSEQFYLNFMAVAPPLGYSTYYIQANSPRMDETSPPFGYSGFSADRGETSIENAFLEVKFSTTPWGLSSIRHKTTSKSTTLQQYYAAYKTQKSGAYLFIPSGQKAVTRSYQQGVVFHGPLVQEAHIVSNKMHASFRLYNPSVDEPLLLPEVGNFVEVQHHVTAAENEEVITRYETGLSSGPNFFTDNGLEMQKRAREPELNLRSHIPEGASQRIETAYYPVISTALLRDSDNRLQFTVLVNQPMGCSSPREGHLEFMLARHLKQDDGRGLGEGVRDTDSLVISHWLLMGPPEEAETHRRRMALQMDHPLSVLSPASEPLVPSDWKAAYHETFQPLKEDLPFNIHLFTLRADTATDEVVLRLLHLSEGTAGPLAASHLPSGDMRASHTISLSNLWDVSNAISWFTVDSQERSLSLYYDVENIPRRLVYDKSVGIQNIGSTNKPTGTQTPLVSQNTKEQGVFISDAALQLQQQANPEPEPEREQRASRWPSNPSTPSPSQTITTTKQERPVSRFMTSPTTPRRQLLSLLDMNGGGGMDPHAPLSSQSAVHLSPLQMKSFVFTLASAYQPNRMQEMEQLLPYQMEKEEEEETLEQQQAEVDEQRMEEEEEEQANEDFYRKLYETQEKGNVDEERVGGGVVLEEVGGDRHGEDDAAAGEEIVMDHLDKGVEEEKETKHRLLNNNVGLEKTYDTNNVVEIGRTAKPPMSNLLVPSEREFFETMARETASELEWERPLMLLLSILNIGLLVALYIQIHRKTSSFLSKATSTSNTALSEEQMLKMV